MMCLLEKENVCDSSLTLCSPWSTNKWGTKCTFYVLKVVYYIYIYILAWIFLRKLYFFANGNFSGCRLDISYDLYCIASKACTPTKSKLFNASLSSYCGSGSICNRFVPCVLCLMFFLCLQLHRKWCIKLPAAAVTIAWVDWPRTVIQTPILIYVAHNPASSTTLQQILACSCLLLVCPLCHKVCTKLWHAKCKTLRMTSRLRHWESEAVKQQGPMARRKRRV